MKQSVYLVCKGLPWFVAHVVRVLAAWGNEWLMRTRTELGIIKPNQQEQIVRRIFHFLFLTVMSLDRIS